MSAFGADKDRRRLLTAARLAVMRTEHRVWLPDRWERESYWVAE